MAEGERLYTAAQANRLLPLLRQLLAAVRIELGLATDPSVSARLRTHADHNGGGIDASAMLHAGRQLERRMALLERRGILLRDAESGLFDFPAELRGEPVYLCWRLGEPEVGFWHPRDSGFSDRRPL